jgi:hypothetical protein
MTSTQAEGIAIIVFGGVIAVAGIGIAIGDAGATGSAAAGAIIGLLVAIAGLARSRPS